MYAVRTLSLHSRFAHDQINYSMPQLKFIYAWPHSALNGNHDVDSVSELYDCPLDTTRMSLLSDRAIGIWYIHYPYLLPTLKKKAHPYVPHTIHLPPSVNSCKRLVL
jgi:hypothetical protein